MQCFPCLYILFLNSVLVYLCWAVNGEQQQSSQPPPSPPSQEKHDDGSSKDVLNVEGAIKHKNLPLTEILYKIHQTTVASSTITSTDAAATATTTTSAAAIVTTEQSLKQLDNCTYSLIVIICRNSTIIPKLTDEFCALKNSKIPTILYMPFNNLTRLKSNDLICNGLDELDISYNHLDYIESGAFVSTPNILNIHLNYNRLTHITSNVFSGAAKLEILDLSHNYISYINADAFKPLVKLVTLNLSFNRLHLMSFVLYLQNHIQAVDVSNNMQQIDLSENLVKLSLMKNVVLTNATRIYCRCENDYHKDVCTYDLAAWLDSCRFKNNDDILHQKRFLLPAQQAIDVSASESLSSYSTILNNNPFHKNLTTTRLYPTQSYYYYAFNEYQFVVIILIFILVCVVVFLKYNLLKKRSYSYKTRRMMTTKRICKKYTSNSHDNINDDNNDDNDNDDDEENQDEINSKNILMEKCNKLGAIRKTKTNVNNKHKNKFKHDKKFNVKYEKCKDFIDELNDNTTLEIYPYAIKRNLPLPPTEVDDSRSFIQEISIKLENERKANVNNSNFISIPMQLRPTTLISTSKNNHNINNNNSSNIIMNTTLNNTNECNNESNYPTNLSSHDEYVLKDMKKHRLFGATKENDVQSNSPLLANQYNNTIKVAGGSTAAATSSTTTSAVAVDSTTTITHDDNDNVPSIITCLPNTTINIENESLTFLRDTNGYISMDSFKTNKN